MAINQFFENKGPFPLSKISELIKATNDLSSDHNLIHDIKDLVSAGNKDITFLNNSKYKDNSFKSKATACITTESLSKFLPKTCKKILVKNVLSSISIVSKLFYPLADMDYPDKLLSESKDFESKYNDVTFGKNVLIGFNVKIGSNSSIGSNSIVESNVEIGKNCVIGSNVIIRNSIIENNVYIQDGCNIGIKGFGFIPHSSKNIRTPHLGKVLIKNNVEIGSNCTIDRGSLSDTVIGNNTFLDNQVHVAHNIKIGDNCMIAGQVGFAGSSNIGNNVVIGGQAGISGHLKIGNNVSIGGGSGVIKDIPDNSKVMGYPAINFKKFIKKIKENA